MKKFITITAIWLLWGFSLGTFILLGPVRMTVDYARENNWSKGQESALVFAYIAILIVVSFTLAYFSNKYIQNHKNPNGVKGLFIGLPVITTILAVMLFLNPSLINNDKEDNEISNGFTIGPYPDEAKLEELKSEGYTTIISLLHPAVVPFEPKLLAEEKVNTKAVGIKLVNIPLLPWITDNEEAIDSLRRLVHNAKGKYYIHCYLGRDRVNVVKEIILQESNLNVEGLSKSRSLDSIETFERGPIYRLTNSVYIIPMPTKEEYFGYIVAAGFKHVIALKDLKNPGVQESINEEKRWLAPYKIPLKVFDINAITEPKMKAIADSVKQLKGAMVIHAFKSEEYESQLFKRIYTAP